MTLRILHTADWHLGQTLQGFSREAEQGLALDALVDIARAQKIDALLLAGDVFDRETPSHRAETLFYRTLVRLRADNPRLAIIIVAGNHDAAGRIEAPNPLYASLGVHAVGHVARRDGALDMARHLIPLADADGAIAAHVLALPYTRPSDLPGYGAASEEPGSPVVREVRKLYAEAVARARNVIGAAPLIATGHLHVKGGDVSEGAERAILVGGEDAAPPDIFNSSLAYVALGHLHKPHPVGARHIRYSGSLIPLSASEIGYAHGVALLTLGAGPIEIAHVPIPRPTPFLRVPAQGAIGLAQVAMELAALALDPNLALEQRPFVQLSLRLDGPTPGLTAELDRIAERFPIRLIRHAVEQAAGAAREATEPAASLAQLDPADLFRQAFLDCHRHPPDHRHLAVFHTACGGA